MNDLPERPWSPREVGMIDLVLNGPMTADGRFADASCDGPATTWTVMKMKNPEGCTVIRLVSPGAPRDPVEVRGA